MSSNLEKKYIYMSFDFSGFKGFTVRQKLKTKLEIEVYECVKSIMTECECGSYRYYAEDIKFFNHKLGDMSRIKLVLEKPKTYTVMSDLDTLYVLAMSVVGFYDDCEEEIASKYNNAFKKIEQFCI